MGRGGIDGDGTGATWLVVVGMTGSVVTGTSGAGAAGAATGAPGAELGGLVAGGAVDDAAPAADPATVSAPRPGVLAVLVEWTPVDPVAAVTTHHDPTITMPTKAIVKVVRRRPLNPAVPPMTLPPTDLRRTSVSASGS
ncbi:MAG TPA: hypothetical protein VII76_01520 [Acidimicrobiales bacterium]